VPRRVDQVQLVRAAVARVVGHAHGVELDRDAALALEVERVEDLGLHLPLLQHARGLDQAVGQVDLPWSMWATMQKLRMDSGRVTDSGRLGGDSRTNPET
jgi:hypothetical protein